MLSLDRAIEEVKSNFTLPSPPDLLNHARQICESDDPSLLDLADLISTDLGLSSAILRTINSPLYGMQRQISDVRQATMLLGLEASSTLIASVLIQQSFVGASAINFERFWDESQRVGSAMVYIGGSIKDKVPSESLYTTGLFHHCGVAAMSIRYHDTYLDCLKAANADPEVDLTVYEDRRYKTSHAVVGYLVGNTWRLPRDICKVILCHHDIEFFKFSQSTEGNLIMATLKIAENIVSSVFSGRDECGWQEYKDIYLDQLGIDMNDYLDLRDDLEHLWNDI